MKNNEKEEFKNIDPKVLQEVYVILKATDDDLTKKIPRSILSVILENKDDNYDYKLEYKKLKKQPIKEETKNILAEIYNKYMNN